jgi:hypothetical protein
LPELKTLIGRDEKVRSAPAGQSIEEMRSIAIMNTLMLGGKVIRREAV